MKTLIDKTVKTRKTHNCWGCTREFQKGSELRYVKILDEEKFYAVYWCEECDEFLDTLEWWEKEEGFYYGDLLNYEEYRDQLRLNKRVMS